MLRRNLYCLSLVLFIGSCAPSTEKSTKDNISDKQTQEIASPVDNENSSSTLRNDEHFHTVEIAQMKFIPEDLIVNKGDTILWINNDMVAHDVTEETNKEWTSGAIPVGATWTTVATKSADYYCSIHVVMKGKITVK